jgi:hypothetical protein
MFVNCSTFFNTAQHSDHNHVCLCLQYSSYRDLRVWIPYTVWPCRGPSDKRAPYLARFTSSGTIQAAVDRGSANKQISSHLSMSFSSTVLYCLPLHSCTNEEGSLPRQVAKAGCQGRLPRQVAKAGCQGRLPRQVAKAEELSAFDSTHTDSSKSYSYLPFSF